MFSGKPLTLKYDCCWKL